MSDHLLTIIELGLVFSNILFSLVHVLIMLYYTIIFEKFTGQITKLSSTRRF